MALRLDVPPSPSGQVTPCGSMGTCWCSATAGLCGALAGAEVGLCRDEALRAHVTLRRLSLPVRQGRRLCLWLPEQSSGLEPGCCPAWTPGGGGEAGEGFSSAWGQFLGRGLRGAPVGRQPSLCFPQQEGRLWGQLLLLGRPEGVPHQVTWSSRAAAENLLLFTVFLAEDPQGHHC